MIFFSMNDRQLKQIVDALDRHTAATNGLTAAVLALNTQDGPTQEQLDKLLAIQRGTSEKLQDVLDESSA